MSSVCCNNHIPALVKKKTPHLSVFYGNSLGSSLNFYVCYSEKVAASNCCLPPLRNWQHLLGRSARKYVHACTRQECIHYVPRGCGREASLERCNLSPSLLGPDLGPLEVSRSVCSWHRSRRCGFQRWTRRLLCFMLYKFLSVWTGSLNRAEPEGSTKAAAVRWDRWCGRSMA